MSKVRGVYVLNHRHEYVEFIGLVKVDDQAMPFVPSTYWHDAVDRIIIFPVSTFLKTGVWIG